MKFEPHCEKTSPGFQIRSNTNQAVQSQKIARGLKFLILDCTIHVENTKTLISSLSLFKRMQIVGFLMARLI